MVSITGSGKKTGTKLSRSVRSLKVPKILMPDYDYDLLEQCRRLIDNAPVAIYEIDFHGPRLKSVNDYMCQITGYTREELLAINPFELLEPASRTLFQERIRKQLSGEKIDSDVEYWGRSKSGLEMYWTFKVSFTYKDGKPDGAIVVGNDITDRKRAELELADAHRLLHIILSQAPVGFAYLDLDLRVKLVNNMLADMIAKPVADHLGKPLSEIMPKLAPDAKKITDRILVTGNPVSGVEVNGETYKIPGFTGYLSESWYPVRDDSGKITGYGVFVENITERRKTEDALRMSEENLTMAQQITHVGSWSWDIGKDRLYWSEEVYRILGQRQGVYLPRATDYVDFIHPDDREFVYQSLKKAKETGSFKMDHRVLTSDGSIKYIHSEGRVLHNEYGKPVRMYGVGQDVTEQKRVEEENRSLLKAVEAERDRLSTLINSISDEVWFADTDKKFVLMNPSASREFCLVRGKVDIEKLAASLEVYRPDGSPRPIEETPPLLALKGEVVRNHEEIIRTPATGELRYRQVSAMPVKDASNNIIGAITVSRDITDSKLNLDARFRSEEKFRKIFESAAIGIVIADKDRQYHSVNDRFCEIVGYTREELLTMGYDRLIHPEDQDIDIRDVRRLLNNEIESFSHDLRYIHSNGTIVWCNLHVSMLPGSGTDDPRLIGILGDITERKRAEVALQDAKLQAELYLDLMGHDINNLHQIALGYLELAREMHPEVDRKELMDKPIEVLQRSALLINNVRKLQKQRDGVFQAQDVDAVRIVSEVYRQFGSVPGKTIYLNQNGHKNCPVRANELLHDVYANLVSNAIRHTGNPAVITIDIDKVIDNGKPCCRVIVEDDGPGIADDAKGRVFYRMQNGTARGMGLGLYLIKSLVKSYDGRVWVGDRVPGDHKKGAKFVVLLPIAENELS